MRGAINPISSMPPFSEPDHDFDEDAEIVGDLDEEEEVEGEVEDLFGDGLERYLVHLDPPLLFYRKCQIQKKQTLTLPMSQGLQGKLADGQLRC